MMPVSTTASYLTWLGTIYRLLPNRMESWEYCPGYRPMEPAGEEFDRFVTCKGLLRQIRKLLQYITDQCKNSGSIQASLCIRS